MKLITKNLKKLRNEQYLKDITLLWFGQGFSSICSNLYGIALAWYIIELTGSSLQMGLVLVVSFVPKIIFSIYSGIIGDKVDKKKILTLLNFTRFTFTIVWGLSLFFREITLYEIYIFTAFFAVVDAFFYPIYSAFIPEILHNKNLSRAASINQMIVRIATIIAPAIAGILILSVPFHGFIIINALGFLVSAFFTSLITFKGTKSKIKNSNIIEDLKSGINYFYNNRVVFWSTILIAFANIGVVSYNVNLANFINKELNITSETYGITLTFFSLGSFLTLLLLSLVKVEQKRGVLYLLSMLIGGAFFLFIPLTDNPILLYIIFFFIGLFFSVTSTISTTILFAATKDEYRSRVLGIASVTSFLSPIGFIIWGIIGDYLSPSNALFFAGIIIILVSLGGFFTKIKAYE